MATSSRCEALFRGRAHVYRHGCGALANPARSLSLSPFLSPASDLGAHIAGYAAMCATTLVVGASSSSPVEGPTADCVLAAHYASEVAARMITIGGDVSCALIAQADGGCVVFQSWSIDALISPVVIPCFKSLVPVCGQNY
jgi:hypothetical protein